MEKFYRLKKDLHCLLAGAILEKQSNGSYKPLNDAYFTENSEIEKSMEGWNEKGSIVENCPEWFERVYSTKSFKGVIFVTKAKLREMLSSEHVNEEGD